MRATHTDTAIRK